MKLSRDGEQGEQGDFPYNRCQNDVITSQNTTIALQETRSQSLLSALQQLPLELWAQVFHEVGYSADKAAYKFFPNGGYLVPHYPVQLVASRADRRATPFLLSQVCSGWKQIIRSTPSLWSFIHIDLSILTSHYSNILRMCFERSQSSPLRLRLEVSEPYRFYSSQTWNFLTSEIFSRCQELNLPPRLTSFSFWKAGPLPSLQTLTFHDYNLTNILHQSSDRFRRLHTICSNSTLTTLTTNCLLRVIGQGILPLSNLTSLDSTGAIDKADLIRIGDIFPAVTVLRLIIPHAYSGLEWRAREVFLPRQLEYLGLKIQMNDLSPFIQSLAAPSTLTNLEVVINPSFHDASEILSGAMEALVSLLRRSWCSLRLLEISLLQDPLPLDLAWLAELSLLSPQLSSLRITTGEAMIHPGYSIGSSTLALCPLLTICSESEAEVDMRKVIFPNLTSLWIRDVRSARHFDYGVGADMARLFLRMAESRSRSASPIWGRAVRLLRAELIVTKAADAHTTGVNLLDNDLIRARERLVEDGMDCIVRL